MKNKKEIAEKILKIRLEIVENNDHDEEIESVCHSLMKIEEALIGHDSPWDEFMYREIKK